MMPASLDEDLNGNLLPFVWTRHSLCKEVKNATPLTRDALQQHLQTFIDAGVKDNICVSSAFDFSSS